jgi:transcriptional regulator of nitric oxide reductase
LKARKSYAIPKYRLTHGKRFILIVYIGIGIVIVKGYRVKPITKHLPIKDSNRIIRLKLRELSAVPVVLIGPPLRVGPVVLQGARL